MTNRAEPEVLVLPDLAALQAAAAERIVALAEQAVAARGRFLIALSGGSAPPGVFLHMTRGELLRRTPWAAFSVIWADERFVPHSSPDSNYSQARAALLDHVPIPAAQIYPVATSYPTAEEAAAVYNRLLAALLAQPGDRIDLAMLGMGPDGHTASLFPGHPALDTPPDTLAVAVYGSPKPPPVRVSLSAAALNRAATALFLVAGADKAANVRAALRGPYAPQRNPTQLVRPPTGHVVWMLDTAAAGEL